MEHDGRIDSRRQRRTGTGRWRGDDLQPQRPAADFTVGFPNLRQIPRRYLLAGSVLFVSYEICLALSLGYAASRQQAIEVGMVNYLWPSLTILFAILFNGQKSSWLVIPGLLLALLGVGWVLGASTACSWRRLSATSSPVRSAICWPLSAPLSGRPTAR